MGEGCQTTCLLQVLLFPLFAAEEMQQTGLSNNSVRCLNNYGLQGRRVNCTWHRHDDFLGEGPFHLNFSDLLGLYSDLICHLSEEALDQFSCSVNSEEGEFTENDEYSVSLYAASSGKELINIAMYEPRLHIKCEPPLDLQSNVSSSKCRMQWRKPEAYKDIFLDDWQWELAFKTSEAPWEQAQNKVWVNKETWVEIESFEFESGVDYVARIRCKTPDVNIHYRSQWSPWSATTKWKAPPGNGQLQQPQESYLLEPVFNPLFLCLGTLLFLLLVLTIFWWSKSHCSTNIPSPAAYFQPLYLSHNGDFKRWAGLAEKSGGNEDKEMPWGHSKGGEEEKALPLDISQLSFCQPTLEAEALSKENSCTWPEMPYYQYMTSKQRGFEGNLKQLQPEAEAPLPSGDAEQKEDSLPCEWGITFQEQDPPETETPVLLLLFGSNDYCTLGDGHRQPGTRPAAEQLLQSISAWGPGQAAKDIP